MNLRVLFFTILFLRSGVDFTINIFQYYYNQYLLLLLNKISFDHRNAPTQAHHPSRLHLVHILQLMDAMSETQLILHLCRYFAIHPSMRVISLFEFHDFSFHFDFILHLFVMGFTDQTDPLLTFFPQYSILGFKIQL